MGSIAKNELRSEGITQSGLNHKLLDTTVKMKSRPDQVIVQVIDDETTEGATTIPGIASDKSLHAGTKIRVDNAELLILRAEE
ncbi:hypothetical protein DPV78_004058 [Talaromyces pinophilus]|nr:hypothetical protein DPV78_004058 [Talaromyces pinophilus]